MNTLPKDIQDVIHTYKSQMEFGEVIKDLNRRPVLPYDCFGCQISKRNSVSRKTKIRLIFKQGDDLLIRHINV